MVKRYSVKSNDGVIEIQGSNDALHIHEIEHVANSLGSNNGLQFDSNGYLKVALSPSGDKDEIAAYQAQYSFSPSSLPSAAVSINAINLEYLGSLKTENGNIAYPAINQKWENYQKGLKVYQKFIKNQNK